MTYNDYENSFTTTFTYDGEEYEFDTDLDYGELYELGEIDYINICEELGIEYDPEVECRVRSIKN